VAAEAKKLWDGETIEARDGVRLEINKATNGRQDSS